MDAAHSDSGWPQGSLHDPQRGGVSPYFPCEAWSGFTMLDQTRTDRKTKAQRRGLPCLKIQTWATQSFSVSQTWATRRPCPTLLAERIVNEDTDDVERCV